MVDKCFLIRTVKYGRGFLRNHHPVSSPGTPTSDGRPQQLAPREIRGIHEPQSMFSVPECEGQGLLQPRCVCRDNRADWRVPRVRENYQGHHLARIRSWVTESEIVISKRTRSYSVSWTTYWCAAPTQCVCQKFLLKSADLEMMFVLLSTFKSIFVIQIDSEGQKFFWQKEQLRTHTYSR